MTYNKDEEVEEIVNKAIRGDWEEIIDFQINPFRESCHAETLAYVMQVLVKKDILSSDLIKGVSVYLVELSRSLGNKQLNRGYYFRREKNAKKFVEQYKKIIASDLYYSKSAKELITEEGEKIRIIEIKLL